MHLYFGGRDPARDFYFGPEIQRWLGEGRLTTLQTVFSRVPDGGGYVQDALRRDAERLRHWVTQGAIVRVCGGRVDALFLLTRTGELVELESGRFDAFGGMRSA